MSEKLGGPMSLRLFASDYEDLDRIAFEVSNELGINVNKSDVIRSMIRDKIKEYKES